jgi:hypothetical protein
MSEHLFEYPIKEPWRKYPWLFRPVVIKGLLAVTISICIAAILVSLIGIPKNAQMTTPGLENVPVPLALGIIISVVLPLPCLFVGLVLGLIPINTVPYKVKFFSFFLIACLLLEGYALKEFIAAVIHG